MVLNRAWYWANFNTRASSHHLSPAGYKRSEPLRPQQLGGRHTWATAWPPCQALGGRLLSCKTLALEGSPRCLGSRKPQGGQTQPGDPSSLLGPQANTSQPDKYHTQKSRSASAGPQGALRLWIHPMTAGCWEPETCHLIYPGLERAVNTPGRRQSRLAPLPSTRPSSSPSPNPVSHTSLQFAGCPTSPPRDQPSPGPQLGATLPTSHSATPAGNPKASPTPQAPPA